MNNTTKFIKENFTIIVFILVIFSFFRECNTTTELKNIKREIAILNDSLYKKKSLELKLDQIKLNTRIEGLKSEKRMIQSTDRKMMDVKRQSDIDKELIVLENRLDEYETLDK